MCLLRYGREQSTARIGNDTTAGEGSRQPEHVAATVSIRGPSGPSPTRRIPHGLPVVAHAHRAEEIRRGIAAGVDNFEDTGRGTMPEYPDDVWELIEGRANTLYWTPTITPLQLYEYTRDNPERIDDPRWHEGLPEEIVEDMYASLQDLQRHGSDPRRDLLAFADDGCFRRCRDTGRGQGR